MRNSDKKQVDIQEKGIAGFERLWVWQKSHQLMIEMHDICKKLPYRGRFKTKDQLERSSSSVPDNIAEGHTSYYYQEKIKAFQVARKEAGEAQNHIRSLQAKQYIKKMKVMNLYRDMRRLSGESMATSTGSGRKKVRENSSPLDLLICCFIGIRIMEKDVRK